MTRTLPDGTTVNVGPSKRTTVDPDRTRSPLFPGTRQTQERGADQ